MSEKSNEYTIAGARWSAIAAGIKKSPPNAKDKPLDLALLELCENTRLAAVFTKNDFRAAPVILAAERLSIVKQSSLTEKLYLLINAGNANAGTGAAGMLAAEQSSACIAKALAVSPERVLPFSTGVIGEPLPVQCFADNAESLATGLEASGWQAASQAIMTTDTVPKYFSRELELADGSIRISGIAKGAGMIKPNMATMLSYIVCDAEIPQISLDSLLTRAVERSFNRITVDGDTSTNDACVLCATGEGAVALDESSSDWPQFERAVSDLLVELAKAIISDAEGASKFIEINIAGGASKRECLQVGYAVAESPLVKTAFFASDPNWGRILAAVGRSGLENLQVEGVTISLNDYVICEAGGRVENYDEERATSIMAQDTIQLGIDLNRGSALETIWTSDLSHDYVRINAEYRT